MWKGSINVLPDARPVAGGVRVVPSGTLARVQPGRLFQRGTRRLRGGRLCDRACGGGPRDADGTASELAALLDEGKALLKALAATAMATGWLPTEPNSVRHSSLTSRVLAHRAGF